MADASALEQDGMSFAQSAVSFDKLGEINTAIFYYTEAAQALLSASMAGSQIPGIVDKANEYILRAEQLKKARLENQQFRQQTVAKTPEQHNKERAEFLLRQAFDEDENGNDKEALELYSQAVELLLSVKQATQDKTLEAKVVKLATQALDRAEDLKKKKTANQSQPAPPPPIQPPAKVKVAPRPLGFNLFDDDEKPAPRRSPMPSPSVQHKAPPGGGGSYTKEEIKVLRTTSFINGREYVPFMSVDMKEKFGYPVPFTDKSGLLALAPKQKNHFKAFVRPDEIFEEPKMIYAVSSFSIKQTLISDCSFVASLAISAQYERRFKRKLITSIIYPQNRQGDPVYNPCGKYMVKLNLNGVLRKVIIDDYLPVDSRGELLCSFSNNKNELWVSLLEKAYMKVMGGYDFPGSNSNIDLHALTGWIPERVAIRVGKDSFDPDKEFKKVMDRFHKGHCLVTLATGELSEVDADRAGLVSTHAYALLDIKIVKGQQLMMLKNPWSHLRWKGNYSETDTVHWTPDMQKALNYDPESAQMIDNGVFWIDYKSVLRYYDVMYINWNPDLFPYTTCIHHTWPAKSGPKKDLYDISDNPQYRLEVKATGATPIWILLTRHITDKDDFADNKEFITVVVYKTGGKRVYYPFDPPPYKDGTRINSPHYLVKMVEDAPGVYHYTLVISQYEKNNTIHYTLRAYTTAEFSLTKIADPYIQSYQKQVTGEWKGATAGGCANNTATHKKNPMYQIQLDNSTTDNHILIEVRGPKEYSVGFEVITVTENNSTASGAFKKKSSGDFRRGFCVLALDNIAGGVYNIIPCTFYPNKEGPFILTVSSSAEMVLARLQ
ncbi:calpain-7-like [Lineus longissimus]|uniref:calpain-7-like n=1 Tax=Lineus longissimus TaxID=88925 RepID=UPI002B4F5672